MLRHYSQAQSNRWIYALALGSNDNASQAIANCLERLAALGELDVSAIYETAPDNGIGANYLNLAVLLHASEPPEHMRPILKTVENNMGRIRQSHHVLIDIDVIAIGNTLEQMQLVSKRLPLAHYVIKPMYDVWPTCPFADVQ